MSKHRLMLTYAGLLVWLTASACFANGTLSGVVRVDGTGAPVVAGASVMTEGEPCYSTVAGSDGGYSLSAPGGTYVVLISAAGLNPQRTSVAIAEGVTKTTDFSLRRPGVSGSSIDMPAPLVWGEPPSAPTPPGDDFPAAFPNMGILPDQTAPEIAEWNDTVKPDESFTITGTRFTTRTGSDAGSDTIVWLWARTSAGVGTLRQIKVWKVQENCITALIPNDIPFGMYLVWVENANGVSAPVCINRTTAKWVGPLGNTCAAGDSKRVYGLNLSYSHGTGTSNVYLQPTAGGAFIPCAITGVEPSEIIFTVPSGIANGSYKVFVHNGQGGIYGWSDGLDLVIASSWVRGTSESVVNPSGTDDTAALQSAIDLQSGHATGGTVRLLAGTYKITDELWINSRVRLLGAGMDSTTIECRGTVLNRHDYVRVHGSYIQIEGLTITAKLDTGVSPVYGILEGPYPQYSWTEADSIKYVNMRLTGDDRTLLLQNSLGYSRVEATGCEFYRQVDAGTQDGWMHDCNLYGGPFGVYSPYLGETEAAFSIGSRVVFENNHVETKNWPYDASKTHPYNYYDNLTTDQYSYKIWAKRVTCPQGGATNFYIGHTMTKDVAVQDNKGEMILFHGGGGQWFGNVTGANGLTLSLRTDTYVDGTTVNILNYGTALSGGQPVPDAVPSYIPTDGGYAVVVAGKGFGQARMIVSHTTTSVTVDRPWRVQPDSTSKIICSHLYYENLMYGNDLNAFPQGYYQDYSASCAIDIDGNGWRNSFESNTSHRNFTARMICANSGGPSYWNMMRNETGTDMYHAGLMVFNWEGQPIGPILLGNAYHNCTVNIYGNQNFWFGGPVGIYGQGTGDVIENATLTGPQGYNLPVQTYGNYSSGGWPDGMVLFRNGNITVNLSPNQPVYVGTSDHKDYLIGNTYSGNSTKYYYASGVTSYSTLVSMSRAVKFRGFPGETIPNQTVSIANPGTKSLTWTVTSNDSWITASVQSGGTVNQEATSGVLLIGVNTTGLSAGKRWGSVTVNISGQSVKVGVCLDLTAPIPVNGLKLWLRSDAGITADGSGRVSAWTDQSGSGNNLTQGTAASQPTFITTGANGYPSIRFAGGDDSLSAAGRVVTGTSQFTTYAYLRPNSVTAPQTVFWQGDSSANSGYGVYLAGSSALKAGWGSSSSEVAGPALTLGAWQLVESRYDASTHKLWLNGTFAGSSPKTTSNFTTGAFMLGNYVPTPTQGFNGDLAEVMVYNRALTDSERATVESYLRGKYGHPTASFTFGPSGGLAPFTVAFDASASSDPEGAIASYAWDFGDGTTGTGVTTTHIYTGTGTYAPKLTITDSDGFTSVTTASLTSYPQATAATISGSPASPVGPGSDVTLIATVTGGYQVQYRFWVKTGSNWNIIRDYGSSTCTWTPTKPGSYDLKVQARSSGSPADYDVESPAITYTVNTLPTIGLKLWLKGDAGVTKDANGLVSAWADQSGSGIVVSQLMSQLKPVFTDYVLNGRPGIRFSGGSCQLQTASTVITGNAFTAFAVARSNAAFDGQPHYIWWVGADSANSGYGAGLFLNGCLRSGWGSWSAAITSPSAAVSGRWYRVSSRYSSGTHDMWLDGVHIGTNSKSGAYAASGFVVGNYAASASNYGLHGDIVELMIYDRGLADAEVQAVEDYLAGRWTPAPPVTEDSIAAAKSLDQGSYISVTAPKIVTTAPTTYKDGGYYIEEPGRASGIKVIGGSPNLWDNITLKGTLIVDPNGEKYLRDATIDTSAIGDPLGALGMINRACYPSGLLVRVWGRVTESGFGYFTIDDGSCSPVRVESSLLTNSISLPNPDDYAAAAGICGLTTGGITVIRVRSQDDVIVENEN